jgi:TolB-like protein/class 3 adenylate cyclase
MERKLAAILAADVVGYSRLMEADEAGTLAALRDRWKTILEPMVAQHRGRIVKLMGDGALVEFASAVNAVQCAVELQGLMADANAGLTVDRRVVLRVGVNLGDVVVEDGDIHGDGVNVAARLEGLAEPGGVYVSGKVRDEICGKLDVAFDDLGEVALKNMAKRVRVYRVEVDKSGARSAIVPPSGGALPLPAKPSVAVLPFDNLSGNPERQYFSDGITEDIITELSRCRSLFVIARNSSFQYRDKATDVRRIARELGVQYVVEGSVREATDRLRVTAQLIDAATGNHLWAERFDRDLGDIFALQDEAVRAIVSTLVVRLETEELELAKRRPPRDLRAYDLCLRGKQCYSLWTREGHAEARRLFEQAVALDPAFARAYAGLAGIYAGAVDYSAWAPNGRDPQSVALEYARRAVALDDTDHQPHIVLAWIYQKQRQYDAARRHLDRALALNPNDADGLADRSLLLTCQGELEAGKAWAEAAIRLNPNHPDYYLLFLSLSHFLTRNYSEAIRLQEMVVAGFPDRKAVEAAIYAQAGDLHKAGESLQEFLRQYPLHWKEPPSARRVADIFSFKRQEDADLLIEGLRKAGLPE